MADAGAILAAAFVAALRREELEPDPGLRLLGHAGTEHTVPEALEGPGGLGELHERLLGDADRTRRGVWYTPAWLAAELVERVVDGRGPVLDPTCGGGVFLLAAADGLLPGRTPSEVIGELRGCDLDPLAVAVSEAALWWWSARLGDPALPGDRIRVGDALAAGALPAAAAVVGNPPFLGQLRTATAAGADRREALRARFGETVRPYTDEAWLFLLGAVETVEPGGRVALLQPMSVLGARDAGPVRAAIDRRAELHGVWVDDGTAFDASVEVCAPILQRGDGGAGNDWTAALAASLAVPDVRLDGTARLGTWAQVVAGFRDEYYGLVDGVREGGDGPVLVTSGAIDPLLHRTDVDVRFAKRRWVRPTVDVARVTDDRARRWIEVQAGPKLVVATQTRVVEAAPDPEGRLVGSVPAIVVRPHDADHLWHLAAALHAPVVTAWMMRRGAGTALSSGACKPTAALLSALPLPTDHAAWDEAAGLAEGLANGAGDWAEFGRLADRAYGVDDAVTARWWLARLPLR